MEIAIPLIALGGLYMVSKQSTNNSEFKREGFDNPMSSGLPNADIQDRNYPDQYSTIVPEADYTSKLSTTNAYTGNSAYTDKFFNPNVSNAQVKNPSIQASVGGISAPLDPTPQTKNYYALTGDQVGADYFQHNNMVPYFGSNIYSRKFSANGTESLMDNYSGAGSQIINKKEQSPLFAPGENYQWPLGMPNMSDFMQSRVNVSAKMSNVKPFQEEAVAPGLGAGYGTDGLGGFNSGMFAREAWLPKTVDELRVDNNPKSSGNLLIGHEGPGDSYVKFNSSSEHHGIQEKHRPDGSFPMGPDRLMTTTGLEKGPTLRAINVDRYVSRPETTQQYTGVAGHAEGASTYVDGEYIPSKHNDLDSYPIIGTYAPNRQGTYAEDYGSKSQFAYPNNRSSNAQPAGGVRQADGYFGVVGSGIGAAIAPLLDILRPSRKENSIGNLRPYQNAKPAVTSSYVYNPQDKPAHTMRETTENSLNHWNIDAGQRGGAYETTAHQPIVNERNTTTDYMYIGGGSAGERGREARPYDAEYNQRNNEVKSALVSSTGYTPAGKIDTLNASINMTAKPKDVILQNNRAVAPAMPSQIPSYYSGGSVSAKTGLYSNMQLDRNGPDVLTALKSNPYALSITKSNGGI